MKRLPKPDEHLIATKLVKLGGKRYAEGEDFRAGAKDARLLKALGRAVAYESRVLATTQHLPPASPPAPVQAPPAPEPIPASAPAQGESAAAPAAPEVPAADAAAPALVTDAPPALAESTPATVVPSNQVTAHVAQKAPAQPPAAEGQPVRRGRPPSR